MSKVRSYSDPEPDPESDPTDPVAIAASDPGTTVAHSEAPSRARRADTAEFTAFYRRSAPRLVAFLRWQGAPLADAAECAQEALAQAYERWSTLQTPYSWCRVVSCRLYARRIASVEKLIENIETAGSPLLAPGTDIDAFEQRHTVLRLLDCLPPRQRQVMAWTYDGAAPTEIAQALRITPEAVRASLKKARGTLRQLLQDNGGELP